MNNSDLGHASGLELPASTRISMIAHCLSVLPEEGCGLLLGTWDPAYVHEAFPTENSAHSAKLYVVEGRDHLRADRKAEQSGWSIMGVFHSHTHTDPYPSPTDVAQAPDPNWHYVLVSFRFAIPVVRSYRIVNGVITEELVTEP